MTSALRFVSEDRAAQIVEFAVSLPLLLVFVVGIFDFSGAYTLKQKLTNVARDAARAAAGGPSNDLSGTSASAGPASVADAFQIVDRYLTANNLSGCGISNTPTATPPIWKYSATAAPCSLSITINRGYYFAANSTTTVDPACAHQTVATGQTAVLSTCVNISYAYPWRFDRVITLLGARASLPSTISATAVAMNEN